MGNGLVVEGEFSKEPSDSWRERLQAAKATLAKRTIPAFIDICREVHAFRLDCDATQGGSEFSARGCEWLRVTQAQLSRWDAVGRRADELMGAPITLPQSEDAICRIASLDDIAFRKALPRLTPDMPRKAVRELVKELNPKPEPSAQDEEDATERKRKRLYEAFMTLPEKHQFILGRAICSHIQAKGWKP